MNVSLIELRRKPHTSISAVKEYQSCPRRFFLKYELKVRPDFRPAALALGVAWHEAVAGWLNGGEVQGVDEQLREDLLQRLKADDIPVLFDDEDENEERFVTRAVEMFKTFRGSVHRPRKVLGTEIAFETELAHPVTGEVLPVPVIGAIDAVVVDHEGVGTLLELKTGKRRWSQDQIEFDQQITLYRRAARELGYDGVRLRVLVTTKTKQPEVQVLDIHRNDADEAELAEVFFGVHRAIAAGANHPLRGWQCRTCPFSGSCR